MSQNEIALTVESALAHTAWLAIIPTTWKAPHLLTAADVGHRRRLLLPADPPRLGGAEGQADLALIVFDAEDDDFGVLVLEDARKFFSPLDEEQVALLEHQVVEAE